MRIVWELYKTPDLEEAKRRAMRMGWAENKVQIRKFKPNKNTDAVYMIEVYEDCNCPNVLRYEP